MGFFPISGLVVGREAGLEGLVVDPQELAGAPLVPLQALEDEARVELLDVLLASPRAKASSRRSVGPCSAGAGGTKGGNRSPSANRTACTNNSPGNRVPYNGTHHGVLELADELADVPGPAAVQVGGEIGTLQREQVLVLLSG
jgi:hypothetical protein